MPPLVIALNGWTFTWDGGRCIHASHPDVDGDVRLLAGPWDSTACISLATKAHVMASIDQFMDTSAPVYLSIPRKRGNVAA